MRAPERSAIAEHIAERRAEDAFMRRLAECHERDRELYEALASDEWPSDDQSR